jgi:trimethylamine--corrinoid protein Co-methyltransferase
MVTVLLCPAPPRKDQPRRVSPIAQKDTEMVEVAPDSRHRGRRSGGRAGNRNRAGTAAISQMPWTIPQNQDAPVEPLRPEQIERIHNGAMRILEEIGILFLNEDALRILKEAGCDVDFTTQRVRMDRAFVMEQVGKAPSTFDITPRNPKHKVSVGGDAMLFVNVSSPPNAMDLDRGRRPGDRESFRDLMKLTQYFNCIHLAGGYPVEPVDLHASVRHLECLYDKLTLTDKVVHAYSLGTERVEDAMEMVRIAGGLTHEEFNASPRMYTNINSSSPLKHDWPMLDGAMRLARRGQPVFVTPFTLAGAMAPVTIAGAIAQQTAEALCAIALLQCVNPGTPVVYGSFTSNVDMKSGAPAFGTPEYIRATQISGQMARYYGLPLRASNACAANAPDAQAAWESAFSLWACVTAKANVVYHSAGWLEGGLIASYEKFVIDCETLQQIVHYMKPVPTEEADVAVDAIAEVGPRGHFFGAEHTQERYETAFYSPFLSDWRNYESWALAGSVETPQRANAIWKQILAEFEPPPLDPAIEEELRAFVDRRKREGGAPTDF